MLGFFTIVMLATSPEAKSSNGHTVGFRLGVYTDADDLFLGGEALAPISPSLRFNPNVEFIFIEHRTFATFNFDIIYDFHVPNRYLLVWAGAGLGALYVNPEGPTDGDTDLAGNLLFGLGFRSGSTIPYIQSKIIISDNTELVVGFGLRF